jgi:hypothetical protein
MRDARDILFICLFIVVFVTSVYASDGTEIYCYTGNAPDYEYIGTVEVFKIDAAPSTCNNVYYNCQESCIGCYINVESIEICTDKDGNQFAKD